MKNPELNSILKRARLPEIPEASLELFPRRIAARLKRTAPPAHTIRSRFPRLAWAGGLLACVLLAFAIGHWRGRMDSDSAKDVLANIKVVRETLALFPNRVRAIVQDEHGLNLVLSDSDDVPTSTPLYVRICDGEHCASFVTFSGQEIQAAGQQLTVLADAHGGIILTGEQLVWSSTERIYAGKHLQIEAKQLGAAVM